MTPQRSALHPISSNEAANFQERFGWELPAAYTGVAAEYRAATEGAALHDASYVGRLKAVGRDTLDLLNRMSTNRVLSLQPGEGMPTILTTDRGRILELITVINAGDYILLITSPGNQRTVIEWLDKYTIMEDLTVEDITAATTMLTVLGPGSQAALESAAGIGLDSVPPFHTMMAELKAPHSPFDNGEPLLVPPFPRGRMWGIRIIRRHLGTLPGFDLILPPNEAEAVWQHLVASGLTPLGMEAYEALRVRHAVPAYGRELGESYNPLEAGLIGSINFEKGCYIGQEVIARLDTYDKVQRHLVLLHFSSQSDAYSGVTLQHNGQDVGVVTSVARIPTTGEVIGLGYARKGAAAVGTRLQLAGSASGWAEIEALPQLFGPG